ncbi:MAG TPA: alpha-ketoglutarate-dependent dioxygenase AlkB [Propionibacteriaceae bacterium]
MRHDEPGCVRVIPGWAPRGAFAELRDQIEWEQHDITMFGRTVPTPRLTAWMADGPYRYSGIVNQPQPWPAALVRLRHQLVTELDVAFNSCLANLYRDGADSMGWHSDDEPELGGQPTIASLSLGDRRTFALRHRVTRQRWDWALGEGDLLVMTAESQRDYAHAVPKTSRPVGPRMNLTFRMFRPDCQTPSARPR